MNTATALIKSLEAEGVEYMLGVPGEENLDVLEALKESSIKFIITRHEQSAAFIAATIGRLTGMPGVVLSTLGPGATNLVTGAAYAQLGAMPLIMITGQKPIRHSKQGAFQIIDVVDMMTPITKYSKQLVEGSMVSATVREAFRLATEERPGATHIEIPEDIAAEKITYKPLPISFTRRPVAEEKSISHVVDLLKKSKHPIIIIGAGANRKRTSQVLTDFVQTFNIPFVPTQMGKGVISDALPQYAGTAALSSDDYVHETIEQADLVINIGHDVVEKPPFIMTGERPVVHVNFDSASVNDIYYPQCEVVGDIANAIWQIKVALEKEGVPKWDSEYHLPAKQKLIEDFNNSIEKATTITPQVLVKTTRECVNDKGIVALDNGMYKIWFARHYDTYHENTLLLDNALATMGAGMPSAIGAKIVHPDRQVVAVVGDGGFMMNSQELETAVRLNLDLVVVILNDASYQMIRWKQSNLGMEDFGLQFNNPNFIMYANSYGAHGHRATTMTDYKQLLSEALEIGGVHVIDLAIDYSDNANGLMIKKLD
ncbi:MAG: acetolactate synthase large subunit [Oleibacter sp.]|nr:acetolactate synthase large subunit [Thalassolituus sp.]